MKNRHTFLNPKFAFLLIQIVKDLKVSSLGLDSADRKFAKLADAQE